MKSGYRLHRFVSAGLLFLLSFSSTACAQPDPELVGQALSAAPESLKGAAAVYSYDKEGLLQLERAGTNDLVCTADNPASEGFEAACFHQSLFAYVARGRELRADGLTGRESVTKRGEEIMAGELAWPEQDATMIIRYGEDARYNAKTGEVENSRLRYVIYTPYATAESTGLPTEPMAPGAPWLMSAGTFRAHIMVVPSTENH